jgi:tetratricopeptide (TPR) repeat protein
MIVKLIDARKDEIPYTYDSTSTYEDILKMQEHIARGISKELGSTLPGNSKALHLTKTEAIDPYLRGKALAYSLNFADSRTEQRQLFRKSIEIDPQFAEAYIMLAASLMSPNGEDHVDSIEHLYRKGFEIYPDNIFGITLKCQFLFLLKKDTVGSVRLAQETVDRDPDNAENIHLLSWLGFLHEYWLQDRREDLALPHYVKGYELDPDFYYSREGTNHIAYIAQFFCNINDYTRGEYYLKEAINRQPNFVWQQDMATLLYRSAQYERLYAYVKEMENSKNKYFVDNLWRAVACLHTARYSEGLRALSKFQFKERANDFEQELVRDFYMEMTTYTLLLERSGRSAEAKKIWQEVIDRELKAKLTDYVILSRCYAKLGEKEKALDCFDKIVFTHLTPLHNADYFSRDLMLESLQKEPRFINKIQKELERLKGVRDRVADMVREKIIVLPRFVERKGLL